MESIRPEGGGLLWQNGQEQEALRIMRPCSAVPVLVGGENSAWIVSPAVLSCWQCSDEEWEAGEPFVCTRTF